MVTFFISKKASKAFCEKCINFKINNTYTMNGLLY